MSGAAEREFGRASSTVSVTASAVICAGSGVLALTVVPADRAAAALAAVCALTCWRVAFVLAVRRGACRPGRGQRLLWVDVAAVGACALTQRWIDVPYLVAEGSGWVQGAVVVSAVSYPWIAGPVSGVGAAALLGTCFGAGAAHDAGLGFGTLVLPSLWMLACAGMSALTAELIRLQTQRADDATARGERARADLLVARARRDAEREHLAALHDTAAATLLMVGLGMVRDDDAWLAEQVERDLAVLAGVPPPAGHQDLVDLVRCAAATSGIEVRFECDQPELLLPAEVAAAFAGAASESLRNVRRHSGVGEALVRLHRAGSTVVLEVSDQGRGLPSLAGGSSRGIEHSIVGRLARVRGHARVENRMPCGVTVRMGWTA